MGSRAVVGISLIAMLMATPSLAQTANQWTGANGSDFSDAGNWTAGAPGGNVVVDYRTNSPVVGGASTVGTATFNSDVTVAAGATLTADKITQSAGVLANSGTVLASGGIVNAGELENTAGSVINGGIANSGGITNFGTINGGIANSAAGIVRLKAGGLLTGGFDNTGTMLMSSDVRGSMINRSRGGLYVFGTNLTGDSDLINSEQGLTVIYSRLTGLKNVVNTATGRTDGDMRVDTFGIVSADSVTNGAGSLLVNKGVISSMGAIANAGTINNGETGTLNGGLANAGTLDNAGTVNGGIANTGIVNNAATGVISGGLTNSGTVTNLGTVNDAVVQSAGLFDNQGRLRAGVTLDGGRLVSSAATSIIEGGLTNAGTAEIAGTLAGPIDNRAGGRIAFVGDTSGDGTVVNQTGATFALTGGNALGLNSMTNAGTIEVSGERTLGTAGLTNAASGSISMVNGAAGDSLTVNGPYSGAEGSRIALDIDMRTGAPKVADTLVVNGTATGKSNVVLNFAGGTAGRLQAPVEVVRVGAGSSLSLNTGVVAARPYINYNLAESASGSGVYQLTSALELSPLTSIASRLSSGLASFHASLHQPIQPLVGRMAASCRASQLVISPFIRGVGGEDRWSDKANAAGGGTSYDASVKSTNRLGGVQGGIDAGLCNAGGSGWNVHVGITGGLVGISGSTTALGAGTGARTITSGSMNLPFFGAYVLLNRGGFNLELGARYDSLEAGLATTGAGGSYLSSADKIKGQGWSVNGLASYRFALGRALYLEPHVGFSTGSMNLGSVQLATGGGDVLTLGRAQSGAVRAGVNLGTTLRSATGMLVSPFAHFSVWSTLGGNLGATAALASIGETATIKGAAGGQFMQAGLGVTARSAAGGLSGFIRADMRFGEAVQGYGVSAGVRLAF